MKKHRSTIRFFAAISALFIAAVVIKVAPQNVAAALYRATSDKFQQGGKQMSIEIPKDIQDPKDYFSLEVSAIGVQIYKCEPKAGASNQFEWKLIAPEADLFDSDGRLIGRHFNDAVNVGPAWEFNDGSRVVGDRDKAQRHNVGNSIPWLRLPTKVTTGKGALSQIKSIQRLVTLGGKPPDEAPDESQKGKELRVYYSATYYFNK